MRMNQLATVYALLLLTTLASASTIPANTGGLPVHVMDPLHGPAMAAATTDNPDKHYEIRTDGHFKDLSGNAMPVSPPAGTHTDWPNNAHIDLRALLTIVAVAPKTAIKQLINPELKPTAC